jgi:hypothetical protein
MFKVPTILEIGVDRGQTALPLIHNLVSLGRPFKWIGIDVRQDSLVYNQLFVMNGVSLVPEIGINGELVNKTLTSEDPSWNVALITGNSLDVLPSMVIDKWKFDLILIDGDHNYATVSKELGYIEDLTRDASLVIMDDYDSSWGNKDLYYKDRQTHESNELLFKPEAIPGKVGVKAAVDDWLQENTSWHGFQLVESVILAPKGISLSVESAATFGYRDSIINFFWEETNTTTRFTDDVIQALCSTEEDGWSYLKLVPPKR